MTSHDHSLVGRVLAALLLLSLALAIALGSAEARDPQWVSDQLLVKSNPRTRAAALTALASEGAVTTAELASLGVSVVRVPAQHRAAVQRRLRATRLFRSVERNYIVGADEVPNDTLYPAQWALPLVQAPLAWDVTRGFGITIAVVDSGVDTSHPDLAAQLVEGFNAIAESADVTDDNGHGTRMAGIAAARGFDAFGVIGLAPEARLMPIKSLDASAQGSYADVAQGIVYAVDHGARVVSLSLGGAASSTTLSSAVAYAVSHGVVVVAAAGNSGASAPNYPAGYADAIAVGASDSQDQRASFSNYGPWLDLMAPGVNITTTALAGTHGGSTGTSPATPFVAAAAALILSANGSLQPSQVASILSMTSDDVGDPGYDIYDGWGRLNVARAVAQATALGQQMDSAEPSAAMLAPEDGDTVEGVVSFEAAVSDDVGVTRVEYTVDGVVVAVAASMPFSAEWNSATAAPGPHLLGVAAFDASGNRGSSTPVAITVAGVQATCDSSGWSCLPGSGSVRTDCLAEWLVPSQGVTSTLHQKGKVSCTDGSTCDADGTEDGTCSFPVSICFAVADERLVTRTGAPACDAEDLDTFQLVVPGYRRAVGDPVDGANAQAVLSAVAALSTGQMEGRCARGAKGLECSADTACDTLSTSHDGVCGLETTSLAGVGGVESCTAAQWVRVPLKQTRTKLKKAVRTLKIMTRGVAETARPPRDKDVLKLECLPPA